jgi:hypothetical protein
MHSVSKVLCYFKRFIFLRTKKKNIVQFVSVLVTVACQELTVPLRSNGAFVRVEDHFKELHPKFCFSQCLEIFKGMRQVSDNIDSTVHIMVVQIRSFRPFI